MKETKKLTKAELNDIKVENSHQNLLKYMETFTGEKRNRRGRPTGYRMSEESKAKTSKTKTGYVHDEKTKKKIAASVTKYWKNKKAEEEI